MVYYFLYSYDIKKCGKNINNVKKVLEVFYFDEKKIASAGNRTGVAGLGGSVANHCAAKYTIIAHDSGCTSGRD